MGRGLSPLQQTMLALARRNHDAEGRRFGSDMGCDCYFPEVYVAAYGWHRAGEWIRRKDRGHWVRAAPPWERDVEGHRAAVYAAVCRAARRLDRRGLAHHVGNAWAGISLTPEGYELAEGLSVKTEVNSDPVLTDSSVGAPAPEGRYPRGTEPGGVVAVGGTLAAGPWDGCLSPRRGPDILWRCGHGHATYDEACACAAQELAGSRPDAVALQAPVGRAGVTAPARTTG